MSNETRADVLIIGAKIFNNGEPPIVEDIAIRKGKVVARGVTASQLEADRVIDGSGKWLMPGLFDIHTHYDLELEIAPDLPESTRHGTTSVVIANCSLGLAFGNQRDGVNDPIVSCYARVENIPKHVLKHCADSVSWDNPKAYLEHLDGLNLGPNVVPLLPHSMLRIDAMGFDASITRDPTRDELETMKAKLGQALDDGYSGFSTDALPFHYLAAQPHTEKTIPTQFAKYTELKELTQVVRDKDAVWQATPPKDSVIGTLKTFLLTSGRLHGKALKTTVVAAMDFAHNQRLSKMAVLLSRLMNSALVKGRFYMQALGAPFTTWGDGAITPLAEEIPELRRLNETDLEDREARMKILNEPGYAEAFRSMWMNGKSGFSLARLKRIMKAEDYALDRNLSSMHIERCPVDAWVGLSFQDVLDRIAAYRQGGHQPVEQEKLQLDGDFAAVRDEADLVLQMLKSFDTDLTWRITTANNNLVRVRELLMNPVLLPGFNDSGAHLTNMAFYDVNLRSLKLAAQGGDQDLSYMVKRLTKDPADLFGVDAGTIYVGDTADLILIDPDKLRAYDGEGSVQRHYREEFSHEQLVNRSNGVVETVIIGGQIAWQNDEPSDELGKRRMGRLLKRQAAA
jgi:N-acyl-D-aspartate/D-glutamate deacylase